MPILGTNGLWFRDGVLSHRQVEILFLIDEWKRLDRSELTDDLHDRMSRSSKRNRVATLTGAERASLSRSIKRLIDAGLIAKEGSLLSMTEHGTAFMESLKQAPEIQTYLQHYGLTWCKAARRAAGLEEAEKRLTMEEAEKAIADYRRQKYGI